jgi:hypothetical protein
METEGLAFMLLNDSHNFIKAVELQKGTKRSVPLTERLSLSNGR